MPASVLSVVALLLAVSLAALSHLPTVSALNSGYGKQIATYSAGGSALFNPLALAVDSSNNVYVADLLYSANYEDFRGRIVKWSSSGADLTSDLNQAVLNSFSTSYGYSYGTSTSVSVIAIDSSNRLYTNNGSTVVRLTANAQAVDYTYPAPYTTVNSLMVEKSSGNLYVFSYSDQTLYVQTSTGTLLSSLSTNFSRYGAPYPVYVTHMTVLSSSQTLALVDGNNGIVWWVKADGSALVAQYNTNNYGYIAGIATDLNNNVLVLTQDNDALIGQLVNATLRTFTAASTYASQGAIYNAHFPAYAVYIDMQMGSDGRLYLLDEEITRVSVFSTTSNAVVAQLHPGWTPSYFSVDNSGVPYICDGSSGDLAKLGSDGSVAQWYTASTLNDGNFLCVWAAVNRAGTMVATVGGYGEQLLNGAADGQNVYTFNTQTGALMSTVKVGNGKAWGTDDLSLGNDGNIYYMLDSQYAMSINVMSQSGVLTNTITLLTHTNYSYYTFNIDPTNTLHAFFLSYNSTGLLWDSYALNGTYLGTRQATDASSSSGGTYYYLNAPRVDSAGTLYYMVRADGANTTTGAKAEAWVNTVAVDGTTTTFWRDSVLLDYVYTLAVDGSNNVYINDATAHSIMKFTGENAPTSQNSAAPQHAYTAAMVAVMVAAVVNVLLSVLV